MSAFDIQDDTQEKINNKYEKVKLLGSGNQGKAYLCKHAQTNQQFVIKQIQLSCMSDQEIQKQYKEVSILKSLSHPNIIKYQDSFLFKKNYLCIVMDYAEGGDLEQRIIQAQKANTLFDCKTILKWFTQLCSAVRFIHNQKIIHRDIKNSNIFLDSNDNILLGDFGISKKLQNPKDKASTIIGTPYFMAPEICNQQPYTNKVDIWAIGIVLFRLVYLKYPFEGFEIFHLMLAISRGQLKFPQTPSSPLKNLIQKLLQNDPNKRPSIEQVFEFEEIKQYLDKSRQEKQINQNQTRLNSCRQTRLTKDISTGNFELQYNRAQSPSLKNIQKSEQKLFEFAVQNQQNIQKNIIQRQMSKHQARDISPGIQKNQNISKLPSLKSPSSCPQNNSNSKQKIQYNVASSPNIMGKQNFVNLKYNSNLENEKNFLNNLNNNYSPKKLNKQYSDCSTSDSSKETPKVLFNNHKADELSPVIQIQKVMRNNLFAKGSEGQVSSSCNNNPFQQQNFQPRLKFSARKYNNAIRLSEQVVTNTPQLKPQIIQTQDNSTPQYLFAPQINIPQSQQQQQQQYTPIIINYKQPKNDIKTRPSLNLKQQFSDNSVSVKENIHQQNQYIEAVKKQMNRPSKEFQVNQLQGQQQPQIIHQIFKQPQKNQEPENFQQAVQDFHDDFEQNQEDQMICSLNTVLSQDFIENNQNIQENNSIEKTNMLRIFKRNSSNNYNSQNSHQLQNNGSNILNPNNNSSGNYAFQNNMSGSSSNNSQNFYNFGANLISNSSNLFNNQSNNQIPQSLDNKQNQDQYQDIQEMFNKNSNLKTSQMQLEDIENENNNQQLLNNYQDDNLAISYNYTRSSLSDINSILQSTQNKEEIVANPEEIIEQLKQQLILLLGEELFFQVSHYATRLILHYDISKIINENMLKDNFLSQCKQYNQASQLMNVDQIVYNLLKIVNYEENNILIG
ncbi:plant dual-specificity MAP kinase kinase family domain protein (macronuclear) [Tetrahymena thermophila SB210]|uniref:non-specific serine/threonine protein kinase n=1 Tax=Tetrahymena thermophila (strain SB210) TaxID=312017 RepID=I7MDV0_TETTS|nr:plant dual-specificity MAP kinase kinase family domain protein [Tetrahymena thermophila SB210]EAR90997.3 plant dual-specificity MAP kinase kinase family domain protein [Tetrahymena thermophila SB210]|eukprot:XP_001011242.3 plant dual-specificity MAP kinase kinase family domain protein [Tetrahymena thermophila SB210]